MIRIDLARERTNKVHFTQHWVRQVTKSSETDPPRCGRRHEAVLLRCRLQRVTLPTEIKRSKEDKLMHLLIQQDEELRSSLAGRWGSQLEVAGEELLHGACLLQHGAHRCRLCLGQAQKEWYTLTNKHFCTPALHLQR